MRDLRHETLNRLEAESMALQRKIIAAVKFSRLRKYVVTDFLDRVTEPGIVAAHEIPNGWGLLVRDGTTLALREPPVVDWLKPERRLAWPEILALAGTKATARGRARAGQQFMIVTRDPETPEDAMRNSPRGGNVGREAKPKSGPVASSVVIAKDVTLGLLRIAGMFELAPTLSPASHLEHE